MSSLCILGVSQKNDVLGIDTEISIYRHKRIIMKPLSHIPCVNIKKVAMPF